MDPVESKKNKTPVVYSKQLVDKIADKLSDGLTLNQISTSFPQWSPHYATLRKWQYEDTYARQKWIEARIIDLPIKLREKLEELKNINLDEMAEHCQKMVIESRISQSMGDKLFEAKRSHVYKVMDLIIRELEVEVPEKWGKRLKIDGTFTETAKKLSKSEIDEELKKMGYMSIPEAKIIEHDDNNNESL